MARTMYDSTNAGDIPAAAQMVAGYVDGLYAWGAAAWAFWEHVPSVRIAVSARTTGPNIHVLDVEPGDAVPGEAPGWVATQRSRGVIDPAVYCSQAALPAVRQAFKDQGIPEPLYWVASWDGIATLPASVIAKQYASDTMSGGHYDLSVVADYWPGVDKDNTVTVTSLDDVKQTFVPASEVSMPLWEAIMHADAYGFENQNLLIGLQAQFGDLASTVVAMRQKIDNLAAAVADLAGKVGTIATPKLEGKFTLTGDGTVTQS